MKRSEDQLTVFENQLRNEGLWCDVNGYSATRHYFVAQNPRSRLAISLCCSYVVDLERLHENTVSIKCLVCDLYLTGRKENRARLDRNLAQILKETEIKRANLKE